MEGGATRAMRAAEHFYRAQPGIRCTKNTMAPAFGLSSRSKAPVGRRGRGVVSVHLHLCSIYSLVKHWVQLPA